MTIRRSRVYPADSVPFTIRDLVSFTPLPKVKPGLRIDGDLSDWAGQPSFPLGKPEQYVALQPGAQPGDIHGDLMVAWDRATMYFAVQVRGKDAASSGGIKLFLSNAEDQRTPDLEDKGDYREYDFLRGPQGVKLVARSRTKGGYGVWYVTCARSPAGRTTRSPSPYGRRRLSYNSCRIAGFDCPRRCWMRRARAIGSGMEAPPSRKTGAPMVTSNWPPMVATNGV